MNFGKAIEALKAGKFVARRGWNGRGMYLWLLPEANGAVLTGWLASQTDMLSDDWEIVTGEPVQPLRRSEMIIAFERDRLRRVLVGMVQCDDLDELKKMEELMKSAPGISESDRECTLMTVRALIEIRP